MAKVKTKISPYTKSLKSKIERYQNSLKMAEIRIKQLVAENDRIAKRHDEQLDKRLTLAKQYDSTILDLAILREKLQQAERARDAEASEHLIWYNQNQATQNALRITIQELRK